MSSLASCRPLAAALLPRTAARLHEARKLDVLTLILMAIALAALEIALKEAPDRGWTAGLVLGLLALCAAAAARVRAAHPPQPGADRRSSQFRRPEVRDRMRPELRAGYRPVRVGLPHAGFPGLRPRPRCAQIGTIMLVTGAAQLVDGADRRRARAAPRRATADGRRLRGLRHWPRAQRLADSGDRLRGHVLAAGHSAAPPSCSACCRRPDWRSGIWRRAASPDASGLFNLMRNLGGAIGLALDRHGHLRPRSDPCGQHSRRAAGWRRRRWRRLSASLWTSLAPPRHARSMPLRWRSCSRWWSEPAWSTPSTMPGQWSRRSPRWRWWPCRWWYVRPPASLDAACCVAVVPKMGAC